MERRKTTFEDARRTVIHRILANLPGLRSASLFYPELRAHPRSRGAQWIKAERTLPWAYCSRNRIRAREALLSLPVRTNLEHAGVTVVPVFFPFTPSSLPPFLFSTSHLFFLCPCCSLVTASPWKRGPKAPSRRATPANWSRRNPTYGVSTRRTEKKKQPMRSKG